MSERGNFAAGVILGTMLGMALGILFAPEDGEHTRARLRRRREEYERLAREQAGRTADQMRRTADDLASRVRANTDEFVTLARAVAEDVVERGRSLLEERTDQLRRAYQTGRDAVVNPPGNPNGTDDEPK
jgi:gas vesicle protein